MEFSLPNWQPQAYGIWTGVLMFAAYIFKGWLETRKLSAADKQANREGFARQVEILISENRNLSGDLTNLRREYDDYRKLCHDETDQLRQQIVHLEDEAAGMRRKFDQLQTSLARQLGIRNGNGSGE